MYLQKTSKLLGIVAHILGFWTIFSVSSNARNQLSRFQSKRNKALRHQKHRGLVFQSLDFLESQIHLLQHSIAEIEILKSGKHWRENGEKSAGFLKRTAVARENKRSITELRDPITGVLYSDHSNISRIATDYYTILYTPSSPDLTARRQLIRAIPSHLKISTEQQEELLASFTIDEILEESKRTPRKSSPGPDGLPYEILYLIMKFPPYQDLISIVYNTALTQAKFPQSWNESIMCLLYKKGDPADMKNYRPLSLANTDYKLFTRILNHRIMEVSTQLISRSQLGFLPGRFIAENGMICQILMEDAQRKWMVAENSGNDNTIDQLDTDIGLLLDQEKAYDRVNLDYMKRVLKKFGFPTKLINCINKLMGDNVIRINLNGHLSTEVAKLRGLKQGDPLSPILYNLTFEPFLLSIINDSQFKGYTMESHPVSYLLSFHLRQVNNCQFHHLPMLFPVSRTQGLKKQRTGTLEMLYRAADLLPRSFDLATINPATAMSLPLLAAVYVPPGSSFSLPHKVKQMKVSDVFQYDPHLHFLHWKAPRDPSLLQWKRAPGSVFRGLTSGQLKLQSYFAPVCRPAPPIESVVTFAPFVQQLQLAEGTSFVAATTSAKTFRAAVLSSVLSPMALRNIAPAQWKWFWSLSLTTIQHNMIYRLIAGYIPHRRLLHFIMPATFASPLCPVCLVTVDSAHHLLFDCPSKEQVRQGIIFEFLWPTTSLGDIKAALLSLDFSDIW
ncbi:hypothetical protein [Parasitella parasitica]|uniref:Reverse transcriptase domain-containing protein n=1 Tax=Parasitella parasitica TaxID=35722 RepID=A0A0B7NJR6_9FUNG|nr:hypothetical protein [Parasitella parasitica]